MKKLLILIPFLLFGFQVLYSQKIIGPDQVKLGETEYYTYEVYVTTFSGFSAVKYYIDPADFAKIEYVRPFGVMPRKEIYFTPYKTGYVKLTGYDPTGRSAQKWIYVVPADSQAKIKKDAANNL